MTRKEDRLKAADALRAIGDRFGAATDLHHAGRALDVTLSLGDVSVMVGLNWCRGDDGVLAHWNSRSRRFRPDFPGDVNPCHGLKATTGAVDFDVLCAFIQSGLHRVVSGSAFVIGGTTDAA